MYNSIYVKVTPNNLLKTWIIIIIVFKLKIQSNRILEILRDSLKFTYVKHRIISKYTKFYKKKKNNIN